MFSFLCDAAYVGELLFLKAGKLSVCLLEGPEYNIGSAEEGPVLFFVFFLFKGAKKNSSLSSRSEGSMILKFSFVL